VAAVFLAAFLSFQIQPMIGKMLLPWFGGSAGVWSVCLLFFQVVLLAGYGYAHLLARWLGFGGQLVVHLTMLVVAVAALDITPDELWKPVDSQAPAGWLLVVLCLSVGPPYFLLTTTSPLLQTWYRRAGGGEPYWLYSLSNLGSLMGLLSYPFVVEPLLGLTTQASFWCGGFLLFGLLVGLLALGTAVCRGGAAAATTGGEANVPGQGTVAPSIGLGRMLAWVGLSAIPSALLLATTNHVCLDVASVPLLWVVPLTLYLITLIVAFGKPQWYRTAVWAVVTMVTLLVAAWALEPASTRLGLLWQILIFCAALFAACMLMHGEMVRLRPPPERLTLFYVATAAGGALGGLSVAIAAPLLLRTYVEFKLLLGIAFLVAAGLLVWRCFRPSAEHAANDQSRSFAWRACWVSAVLIVPCGGLFFSSLGGAFAKPTQTRQIDVNRDFYGVVEVLDHDVGEPPLRAMKHGRTWHGVQILSPGGGRAPLMYYHPGSGVGWLLQTMRTQGQSLRVGVVGLGTGTLAAYGQAGDYFRFYEISPVVARMAREHFTYLRDSPAAIEVVLGDARLSLEREEGQQFDVLVLDAFSSDAVPLHLLTLEAFAGYFRHLRPGGVIAAHVSNLHVDLTGPVHAAARQLGCHDAHIRTRMDVDLARFPAAWHLLTRDAAIIDRAVQEKAAVRPPAESGTVWTDDYSNLLSALL
jgi:SAM-dependent methyltransferase